MATTRTEGEVGNARVPCRCCPARAVTVEQVPWSRLRRLLLPSNDRLDWEGAVAELGGTVVGDGVERFFCPRCGYDWIETAYDLRGREGRIEHLTFAPLTGDSFTILLRIETNSRNGEEEVVQERYLRGRFPKPYASWFAALTHQRRQFAEGITKKRSGASGPGRTSARRQCTSGSPSSTPSRVPGQKTSGRRAVSAAHRPKENPPHPPPGGFPDS